jgi:hypothetical protein
VAVISRGDVGLDLSLREPEDIQLQRLTAIYYDLNLLYEFCVLVSRDEYLGYRFDQYFWRRNGQPLLDDQRLILRGLSYGSPAISRFGIANAVAVSGVLWTLVQGIERVAMIGPNREHIRAQAVEALANAAKLRAEAADTYRRPDTVTPSLDTAAARRGDAALQTLDTLTRRLSAQRLEIDALRIYTISESR